MQPGTNPTSRPSGASTEECPKSQRVDGKKHSWVFDGDDPYIVCHWCAQRRDAITGEPTHTHADDMFHPLSCGACLAIGVRALIDGFKRGAGAASTEATPHDLGPVGDRYRLHLGGPVEIAARCPHCQKRVVVEARASTEATPPRPDPKISDALWRAAESGDLEAFAQVVAWTDARTSWGGPDGGPDATMQVQSLSALARRSLGRASTEATPHTVQWIDAGRDEPPENGYWRCSCGQSFAPDGVDEYAEHRASTEATERPDLRAALERGLEAIRDASSDPKSQALADSMLAALTGATSPSEPSRELHWTDPGLHTTHPDGTVTVRPSAPEEERAP